MLPAANLLALYDDAGATVLGTATLGSSVVLENSSCRVAAAGASVSLTGTDVTVVLPYTFTAAFSGGKTLYAWASSMAGVYSSTLEGGDWLARSQVTGVAPTPVGVGQALTITGLGFGAAPNGNSVAINGTAAPGVQSWSDTQIVVTVPPGATSGPVAVITNGTPSNAVAVTVLGDGPTLVSLAPPFGPAGTPVVLTGVSFGATQGTSTVTVNGTLAAASAWSDTAITVTVPAGATSGPVLVTRNGLDSNGLSFAVGDDEVVYYHTDGIGSLRMVTGATGQTIARHDYQPFGVEWLPPPGSQERVRFDGDGARPGDRRQFLDAAQLPRRAVPPQWNGRFTAVDPLMLVDRNIGDPQSWNRYTYVRNNPLRYIDPDGRSWWSKLLKLAWKGGDAAATIAGNLEDVETLLSEQSTMLERLMAGAMLASEVAPISGRDAREVLELGARWRARMLPEVTRSVELTQDGLEHIVKRHWATSGTWGMGHFQEGLTARNLRDMINNAVEKGTIRQNTNGRPGHIFEYDFGRTIGTNGKGAATSRLRVVRNTDGTVTTAFPY